MNNKLEIKNIFAKDNASSLLKFIEKINAKNPRERITVCVDLDGTLLQEDSTAGAFRYFLKNKIYMLPIALSWALRGKAFLNIKLENIFLFIVQNYINIIQLS